MYLVLFVILIVLLYLLAIRPSAKHKKRACAFCKNSFAHRGLFGEVPENTIPAFCRAKEAGVGIELDVRLTRDHEVVVFHDDTLLRAAGVDRRIDEMTYQEIQAYPLFGSEEIMPRFSDVLKEVDGDVPLLVEIKALFDCEELCENVAKLVDEYQGDVAIESFSPLALRWFAKNQPEYLRGQLSTRFESKEIPIWQRFVVGNLLTNCFAKPDFIAYEDRHKNQISFVVCRQLFKPPVLFWTVRGKKEGCIFEEN